MTLILVRALCALLLTIGLSACVHRYDVHCDLVDGDWVCEGTAGGSMPDKTPGI